MNTREWVCPTVTVPGVWATPVTWRLQVEITQLTLKKKKESWARDIAQWYTTGLMYARPWVPSPGIYVCNTHTHTHTHAHARAHTHTHTHTHTQWIRHQFTAGQLNMLSWELCDCPGVHTCTLAAGREATEAFEMACVDHHSHISRDFQQVWVGKLEWKILRNE
jgi:hypothetical protein